MADFFMGQIMMTGFGFAQKGFAACNGTLMPVQQNAALFSLLGTTYGGNGSQNFALPDLRGRTPAGGFASQNTNWQPGAYAMGMVAGVEQVGLTGDQNGPHTHGFFATTAAGTSAYLDGNELMSTVEPNTSFLYGPPAALIPLGGGPTSSAGAGAPHDNMQPFEVINFNIALIGLYPSRN